MLVDRIAGRYALALYKLAAEKKLEAEVVKDFAYIDAAFEQSPELRVFLRSPLITHVRKAPILARIFDDKLSELTRLFIRTLTLRSREALLPNIAAEFMHLYYKAQNITEAKLVTARPVEPALKAAILSKLEQQLGQKVILDEALNPALIGGFEIHIGTAVVDASVANTLRRLKKEFTQQMFSA